MGITVKYKPIPLGLFLLSILDAPVFPCRSVIKADFKIILDTSPFYLFIFLFNWSFVLFCIFLNNLIYNYIVFTHLRSTRICFDTGRFSVTVLSAKVQTPDYYSTVACASHTILPAVVVFVGL